MKKVETIIPGKSKPVKWLLSGVMILISLGVLSGAGWYGVETALEHTGGAEFCESCHTMKPMILAYRDDIHGGNNKAGIAAECVACHLPHDNLLNHLLTKQITGAHDLWAEYTSDLDKIDWKAKRKERESYVYDSGCLTCHSNLEQATSANLKAFVAHRPYFLGTIEKKCVSCHESAGHSNLSEFLSLSLKEKERI